MKNNLLAMLLNCAMAFLLIVCMVLCVQHVVLNREYRSLTTQVNQLNAWRNEATALAVDCLEYNKRNPAIQPILEKAGLIAKTPTPAKPAK